MREKKIIEKRYQRKTRSGNACIVIPIFWLLKRKARFEMCHNRVEVGTASPSELNIEKKSSRLITDKLIGLSQEERKAKE